MTKTFLFLTLISIPAAAVAQTGDPLLRRWVGSRPNGAPLFLDFHGDSMLVVNDVLIMDFWYGPDSIIAYNADTSFALRYDFSYDKMLIRTIEGHTITMSPQLIDARPVFHGQGGTFGTWIAQTPDGELRLDIMRIGNIARWRKENTTWVSGTYNRSSRTFTFTWDVDSLAPRPPPQDEATAGRGAADSAHIWVGYLDTEGYQFLFDRTEPGTSVAIFRRVFRREDQ
jgi:hypothetical protein